MLKIGVGIALVLAVGWFALPNVRPVILGLAPFTLLALCPLTMVFAMRGMTADDHQCASCDHDAHTTRKEVMGHE